VWERWGNCKKNAWCDRKGEDDPGAEETEIKLVRQRNIHGFFTDSEEKGDPGRYRLIEISKRKITRSDVSRDYPKKKKTVEGTQARQ